VSKSFFLTPYPRSSGLPPIVFLPQKSSPLSNWRLQFFPIDFFLSLFPKVFFFQPPTLYPFLFSHGEFTLSLCIPGFTPLPRSLTFLFVRCRPEPHCPLASTTESAPSRWYYTIALAPPALFLPVVGDLIVLRRPVYRWFLPLT